jgi:hypothetical protein
MLLRDQIFWRDIKNLSITCATAMMVGDDDYANTYQFTNLDVVSEYVGEQLWIHYSAKMITQFARNVWQ